ncbi:pyridoxal-phosphate dependent enzyme [Thermosphaera chiliense]|uniref:Pyridoxal-phosphate dependent enzyme n=1 Tax=Thermosphaera chiliense TaxID=3402707 RepID=A0A7M1URK2_9CREN|nr:pyridoxal-phosphate dependent enzyme [Thermosphaera aggregans]QOR94147.1 pyridoxal-phosphate dependent enzyme [Thermosphaera aggregans]
MQFKCSSCGEVFWDIKRITCPYCNSLLTSVFEWHFSIREDLKGIWRFANMLPRFENTITMGEANTPLLESSRLFKGMNVYFKDEGRNPTGSFRDRVAPLIIADALDTGVKKLILASDGNMGASIAAYAARVGLKVTVYGPSSMEDAKALLIRAYGAKLILSDQSIESLLETVSRKTASGKTYNASTLHNPLSIEGLKTIAYEIFLDLKRVPEKVFLPLGSGVTLLALYKGFKELVDAGVADRIPRLIGIEHCGSPKYSQVLKERVEKCREPVLTGLGYSQPYIKEAVLKIIEDYGDVVVIDSSGAVKAAKLLSKKEGLFVEPSSAVSLAGFFKYGEVEDSVILLTGHGLKAPLLYTRPNRKRFSTPFPGITKKMILELISNKPGLTGYEVWKHLGIDVTPQAVYQHLRDLVEMGYVEAKLDAGVKKYFARHIESFT